MSNKLYANNPKLEPFRLCSWYHLLEQCGCYFTCISKGARWYAIFDERMSTHYHANENEEVEKITEIDYPAMLCNCGFEIVEEEAKVIARIARNYAAIQRTLPEETDEEYLQLSGKPDYLRPFPRYIRRDWVENFEQFADWAEQSQGFKL
jgi:hypothetical protein